MSRIRSIKPEWLEDEALSMASADARVLSIGLICMADDYGNGRAGLAVLAGRVFPGRTFDATESALKELEALGYCTVYEVRGQRYFAIRNWDKHQRVDRPGAPKVPGPEEADQDGGQCRDTVNREPAGPVPVSVEGDTGKSVSRSPRNSQEKSRVLQTSRASPSPPGLFPDPYKADPDPPEKHGNARARGAKPKPKPRSKHVAIPLPEDWQPSSEQLAALSEKYQVPAERLRQEVPEFRWFWRDGPRAGQRRSAMGWSRSFGVRIESLASRGHLYAERKPPTRGNGKPPGLIEHERHRETSEERIQRRRGILSAALRGEYGPAVKETALLAKTREAKAQLVEDIENRNPATRLAEVFGAAR